MEQIAAVLQQTLSPDAGTRKSAEQQLRQGERTPGLGNSFQATSHYYCSGYCQILLELVCSESMPAEIRMAAAIALKNFVKVNWGPSPEFDVAPEEEDKIRKFVLEAMFACKGNLQNQLSHALHLIAKRDFPSKWPELVPFLAVHLQSDDLDKLIPTLSAMEQLFKKFKYESKSMDLWSELKSCLLAVQAPLTNLFIKMVGFVSQQNQLGPDGVAQWLNLMCLIVKVYHSLCVQDIPEYFEDHLKPWMDGFLQLLALDCSSQVSSAGEPTSLDQLKTEICEVVTLYAQRYEEEIMPFMQDIMQAVWHLVEATGNETRYDTMVCAALDFLAMICQRTYYESYFAAEGVLGLIANSVCVKNMTLRQEDLELFEDEPLDYMKRDLEGTDIGTRRRGAIDLVRALCRRFETQLFQILVQIIGELRNAGNWKKLDVVYCLVTAMAAKGETARAGAITTSQLINVTEFYTQQVRQHLTGPVNENPILKADALKFSVTFRNQFSPEVLIEVVRACDQLLTAELPVIHKYVAYALDKILITKNEQGQLVFSAQIVPVASLLSNLVTAFEKDPKSQNSPYLIKAILRVISIIDDESAHHAGAIASRLAVLVDATTKNPADPVHTHFLFETMCVLIKKTTTILQGSLDTQLFPLIEAILTQDKEDLIPYALQLIGALFASNVMRKAPPGQFASFVGFLLNEQLWSRSANIPAILTVLEFYLKYAPQTVLPEYGKVLMGHFVRLVCIKALDQHAIQLASALLPHLEMITDPQSPANVILSQMFNRMQNSKTSKFIKHFCLFLFKFIILRGAEDFIKVVFISK
ncbi:hypothetical protein WR25_18843 isoform J [Diploscapter pachys]|uniref:Exportin-2 n=2 Tax=Diploscapter pachys TaxID=2018661 RepID=A0A2A2KIA1_9BILA|nr:hypothetical protein WR25_18843 isoform J [Diploscapter pachys]